MRPTHGYGTYAESCGKKSPATKATMYWNHGKSRSQRQPSCGICRPCEGPTRLLTDAVLNGRRYIKWMQEYGVGGGKADLLKVLEACTKELQKHSRYNNDVRCLRVWIQYVSAAAARTRQRCTRCCHVCRRYRAVRSGLCCYLTDLQPPSLSCTG